MAKRETPQEWQVLMDRRGISSARDLATKADVSVQAVLRLMHREGRPTEDIIAAVADALGVGVRRIRLLAGVPAGEETPFVLPAEANRLNDRQRDAVIEIVRLLLDSPMSAAPGRSSSGERGLRVASKRERDPDDTGR